MEMMCLSDALSPHASKTAPFHKWFDYTVTWLQAFTGVPWSHDAASSLLVLVYLSQFSHTTWCGFWTSQWNLLLGLLPPLFVIEEAVNKGVHNCSFALHNISQTSAILQELKIQLLLFWETTMEIISTLQMLSLARGRFPVRHCHIRNAEQFPKSAVTQFLKQIQWNLTIKTNHGIPNILPYFRCSFACNSVNRGWL